ncbi:uncharacterized protein LOC127529646 [Erpetoichthys calabaricus]|uniref:uncharacterized protein LOC127529646 n=1 Tax=Erpetoichthys calabaricus TaxID=27687 RepID=UPI0022340A28|nr:uncharacterized protein LOC127529646 [Erpetoichthys calabaricus]
MRARKEKQKLKRDHAYDKKRKRSFQSQWLKEFPWVNADDTDSVFCQICRQYPLIADKTSTLFTGKKVDRKDTLQSHQLSVKHIACMSKHESKSKKKVGSIEKAFSKVERLEVERYARLFNAASLEEFDPLPAVEFWLSSSNRHITHKKPEKSSASTSAGPSIQEPCSSAQAEMNSIQPMLSEMVKILGGEDVARQKLKNKAENESGQCSVM